MPDKVTVIAFHKARPGKEAALKESLLALCAPTRAEKGCIKYDLHESADDRRCLCFMKTGQAKRFCPA